MHHGYFGYFGTCGAEVQLGGGGWRRSSHKPLQVPRGRSPVGGGGREGDSPLL